MYCLLHSFILPLFLRNSYVEIPKGYISLDFMQIDKGRSCFLLKEKKNRKKETGKEGYDWIGFIFYEKKRIKKKRKEDGWWIYYIFVDRIANDDIRFCMY